jgi:superfamily I DNA/RNA helicase
MKLYFAKIYHRGLIKQLTEMERSGGIRQGAADKAKRIIADVLLGTQIRVPVTNHGESRIRHCVKYNLGDGCRLVTYQNQDRFIPLYVGDHEACDDWLRANARLDGNQLEGRNPAVQADETVDLLAIPDEPVEQPSEYIHIKSTQDVPSDEALLEEILSENRYRDWLLYLHADQQAVVQEEFDRPVIVTGVSGAGKTCVLAHRAVRLAKERSGQSIAILTLDRELAGLIKSLVNMADPLIRNIHVMPFYEAYRLVLSQDRVCIKQYLNQMATQCRRLNLGNQMALQVSKCRDFLLEQQHFQPGAPARWLHQVPDVRTTWNDFIEHHSFGFTPTDQIRVELGRDLPRGLNLSDYLRQEVEWIRSRFSVPERTNEYLAVERQGRRIRFDAEAVRPLAAELSLLYEIWLLNHRIADCLGLTQVLALALNQEQLPHFPWEVVLVDEFQDLSTLDLRVIREMHRGVDGDLVLFGDHKQQIFVRDFKLSRAGLARNQVRTRTLRKNYRNTRQILETALKLLQADLEPEDVNEPVLTLDPELAERQGEVPRIMAVLEPELFALQEAKAYMEENSPEWPVAILVASTDEMISDVFVARHTGSFPCRRLTADYLEHREQINVSNLIHCKGFEFSAVWIVGLDGNMFPAPGVPEGEHWREAQRLYVAMTRARDKLTLLYSRGSGVNIMLQKLIKAEGPLP